MFNSLKKVVEECILNVLHYAQRYKVIVLPNRDFTMVQFTNSVGYFFNRYPIEITVSGN